MQNYQAAWVSDCNLSIPEEVELCVRSLQTQKSLAQVLRGLPVHVGTGSDQVLTDQASPQDAASVWQRRPCSAKS